MNRPYDDLRREYAEGMRDFLSGAGEDALQKGYEIGRKAIAQGLGLLEMATLQQEALGALFQTQPPEEREAAARRSFEFFSESLAPFEMGLRGFREANATLQGVNAELLRRREEAECRADDLQRMHERLKGAQSQLVQTEKLAALGQLVAGVAHEINNPLSFVSNNVAVMQRDLSHIADLMRIYQEADGLLQAHLPETYRRIRELAERIDLGYTLDNLVGLQERSRDGLRRIHQIVLDLRNFARLDEGDLHEVDLNAGVVSTLNIIGALARQQHVEVRQDLGVLPLVACYPAKINQVLLNLVVNAIDASRAGDTVTVRTRAAAGGVEIHVEDTGTGIQPAHRDRIFDPFFTTKPPGKGTGLGLSISHGIVADHGGRIEVASTPGQGAHFTVHLPLNAVSRRGSQ